MEDARIIKVGPLEITIPESLEPLKNLPEEPPERRSFAFQTSQALIMAHLDSIARESAMPFDDPEQVVASIHRDLGDDQGLIEVRNGTTNADRPVIYSIVKTANHPEGVQYFMLMHIDYGRNALQASVFASEYGMTGMRDGQVYAFARNHGYIGPDGSGWMCDPYDGDYARGVLMNMSEDERFDQDFPEHPLSVERGLRDALVALN